MNVTSPTVAPPAALADAESCCVAPKLMSVDVPGVTATETATDVMSATPPQAAMTVIARERMEGRTGKNRRSIRTPWTVR